MPFTFDAPNAGAQGLPGAAVSGNQVTGHYGITFTDQLGVTYTSPKDAFPIVSPTTGQALSALEFQTRMNMLFNNHTRTVVVTRSSTFNSVMCYFYRIEFTGAGVGGAVQLLAPNIQYLSTTAVASTALKVTIPPYHLH